MKTLLLACILCLNVAINIHAKPNYLLFDELTKEAPKTLQKDNVKQSYSSGISYSTLLYTIPSGLPLNSQVVHRFTYHNIDNHTFAFLGIGQPSSVKGSGVLEFYNDNITIAETSLSMLHLGGGLSNLPYLSGDVYKGYIEIALQSYRGKHTSVIISGYSFAVGITTQPTINNSNIAFVPMAAVRLEQLTTLSIDGESGSLNAPVTDIAFQVGFSMHYLY